MYQKCYCKSNKSRKTQFKSLNKVLCATLMTGQKFEELTVRKTFQQNALQWSDLVWCFGLVFFFFSIVGEMGAHLRDALCLELLATILWQIIVNPKLLILQSIQQDLRQIIYCAFIRIKCNIYLYTFFFFTSDLDLIDGMHQNLILNRLKHLASEISLQYNCQSHMITCSFKFTILFNPSAFS